ncbi:hypothetical protein GCK72_015776 [Caenorhabditis remanei]|uniref:Tyrosine-protein phosphatase domain-containing protein n=1 Tax=Caenorhabditis remanei TaxID=31234 RepID=A0A6A5GXE2_CAERE|nr:hypothetical protein GCK72_015776 [Caenorhabditis remanei]KAF1759311.1 hypothetical protein GCK72_015776 [Caenorhabditis remanei]
MCTAFINSDNRYKSGWNSFESSFFTRRSSCSHCSITAERLRYRDPSSPLDIISERDKRYSKRLFTDFVAHISIIARLANTIQMQSDLMNNQDMHYKVGELFNIGKIDIAELKEINTTRTLEFMQVFNKTVGSIDNTVIDGEKRFQLWEAIRKITKELGEIKDFPKRDAFVKDGKQFYDAFNRDAFNEAWPPLKDTLSTLRVLRNFSTESSTTRREKDADVSKFVALKKQVGKTLLVVVKLKELMDRLSPFEGWSFVDKRAVLSKPERLIQAIKWRQEVQALGAANDEKKKSLKKNFGEEYVMGESVTAFGDVFEHFEKNFLKYSSNPSSDLRGFQAMTLLASETEDRWFKKVFKNIGDMKKMTKSLKAIFSLTNATKSISSHFSTDLETRIAIEDVNSIVKEFLKRTATGGGSVWYLGKFEYCGDIGSVVNETLMRKALYPLTGSQELPERFADFWSREDFSRGSLQSLLDDLNSVKRILNPVNSTDNLYWFKQIPRLLTELNTNGAMKRLENKVEKLLDSSNTFDADSLYYASMYSFYDHEVTDNFLKLPEVIREHFVYTCLNSYQDHSEIAYEATRLIRLMRRLGVEGTKRVNEYIHKVAKILESLDEFESILSQMKENSNDGVEKVNEIDKLVVARIDKATVESNAKLEFDHMAKFDTNDEMKKLWPLNKVLSSLTNGLNYFEEHLQNFDFRSLKNLTDYDMFFKKLEGMPDVTMDPESLIQVLNYFIKNTMDDYRIDEFIETKKKLIQCSSMDLDFEKHFQGVGDAFQKFGDFLTQALAQVVLDPVQDHSVTPVQDHSVTPVQDHSVTPVQDHSVAPVQNHSVAPVQDHSVAPVQDQDIQKEDETDYTSIIVGCVVFVACLSATVAIFILWKKKLLCFKRKGDSVECDVIDMDPVDNKPVLPPHLIIVAIGTQTFGRHPEHYELWTQLMEHVRTAPTPEERQFPYLPLKESMYWDPNIKLNPFTALQTVRLHGNKFRSRLGTVFYAMQAPMEANSMHDDTRADFLAMLVIDEVEFIVFLGETSSCGHYFLERTGSLTIENFTVTTEGEQQFQNSTDIVVRTLTVKDNKKKTQRKVKQFQVKNWKEGDIPNCGYQPLEAIMTEICKRKTPVVVHCTSGTGRTMAFIGLEYISRALEANEEMTFADAFKKLIEKRYSAFETSRQIGWLQVGVVYFMSIRRNAELVMYQNIEGVFRDMVERNVGVPKGIKF